MPKVISGSWRRRARRDAPCLILRKSLLAIIIAVLNVINVGLIQASCSPDSEANLKKTLAAAESAAAKGAQIICTQELFRSQYFCQTEDHRFFQFAEPIPGPSTEAFQKFAKQKQVVVIASLFEKRPLVFTTTRQSSLMPTAHCSGVTQNAYSDDPLYYEKFYFTPGDLGFRAWQTRYAKIGVLVCWTNGIRKRLD